MKWSCCHVVLVLCCISFFRIFTGYSRALVVFCYDFHIFHYFYLLHIVIFLVCIRRATAAQMYNLNYSLVSLAFYFWVCFFFDFVQNAHLFKTSLYFYHDSPNWYKYSFLSRFIKLKMHNHSFWFWFFLSSCWSSVCCWRTNI